MQRIKPPNIDQNHPCYTAIKNTAKHIGFTLNDGSIMAHKPEITLAFETLSIAILAKGNLNPGLKRMIGLVSSNTAGCDYCVSHTAFTADKHGVPKEKIQALWDFKTSHLFSKDEKIALDIALKASMHPNQVSDEDFEELKKYYSDEDIVELVSVIGLFGFLNRFNLTLATDMEELPKQIFNTIKKKDHE